MNHKLFYHLAPFMGGLVFAVGLGISGMLEPKKISGFLNIFGDWNPSLIFVMLGAIAVHMLFYRLIIKRSSPLFDIQFHLPSKKNLDRKLLLGSFIFGVGWAIAGLCPGPGIVSFVTGHSYALVFVITMIVGIFLAKTLEKRI